MIQKRLFYEGWLNGLLFLFMTLATSNATAALILSTPGHLSEGYPYSEMGLWWKYDEDPAISAEIEEQVQRVWLRVYEVDNPSNYKGDYVGSCSASFPCYGCGMQYHKWLSPRTFASTAECGTILKPEQWYKWSLKVDFQDGSHWIKSAAFKTGHYQDIIIDDESPNFTQGGPGPFSERGRGYANRSLLVNTTWEETENNYCQWEWTIPEERDYEVSVYIPITSYGGRRLGTSDQAIYKLWRKGIPGPDYKSTKIIDQTQNVNSLWRSLGTFYFKAGQASLRLNDNTGESAPLGRQLVCDAVRVRPRLGTVGKADAGTPAQRTRSSNLSSPGLFYPMNRQIIPLSSTKIDNVITPKGGVTFHWNPVQDISQYRVQISEQPFKDEESLEEKNEEPPKCDECTHEITMQTYHLGIEGEGKFEFDKTYYWRVRAEKTEIEESWFSERKYLRFGPWSQVRQFKVIQSPTGSGNNSVQCKELKQKDGIDFGQNYQYTVDQVNSRGRKFSKNKYIDKTDATAQICYPESQSTPMPVVLFFHGNIENCLRACKECDDADKDKNGKVSYYDWAGKFTQSPKAKQLIPIGACPEADIIPSYKGFNYLLKELASHGLFAISISGHDLQGRDGSKWIKARGRLIVKFLDKLKHWNETGKDTFGGIFKNKLNLTKVGLVGHSRGGEAILEVPQLLKKLKIEGVSIMALNAIAPTDEISHKPGDIPYYLLQGLRDNDMFVLQGLVAYQHYDNKAVPKMKALVYGANHNFFNTEWKLDDGSLVVDNSRHNMLAEEQQEVARFTNTAFMRWHLLGEEKYQNIFKGNYKHQRIFWTYDAGDNHLKVIDDFEQVFETQFDQDGYGTDQNTLGGTNHFNGRYFEEQLLYFKNTDRHYATIMDDIIQNNHFFEFTVGMALEWNVTTQKTTAVYRMVSKEEEPFPPINNWPYFSLLAANVIPGEETLIFSENQTSIKFGVTLETKTENQQKAKRSQTVDSSTLARIPHPYQRTWLFCQLNEQGGCIDYEQAVLTGIRIPITEFGLSHEELNNLTAIEIEMDAAGNQEGNIALDDIFFTQ
jgi:hypothetical protein